MKNAPIYALFAFTLIAVPAFGQNVTATITGTVSDTSGGIIAGARVTVLNRDTNVVAWRGATGSSGTYVAPGLPVGVYDITGEQPGFKKFRAGNIELSVGQRAEVNLRLQPGDVAESVTVTADAATKLLETADSSLSTLITPSEVNDLPLPSRDPMNLLVLVNGVSTGGDPTAVNTSVLSINGSRSLNSEVMVDGVSVVSPTTGQPVLLPSQDAIQEFRVMTSAYSAESGRTSGGTITTVTKSGTNQIHGSLYELFRNEDLDGNNFFNNVRNIHRPQDRYNQFGGAIGGPVWIPKLYDGRNKTFFFFNLDQTVQRVSSIPISTVPSGAFKSGDFSSSTIAVSDPLSRAPFPRNVLPASRLDPVAVKVMALLPEANSLGTPDPLNSRSINNYVNPQVLLNTTPKYTGRIDEDFGSRDRLFGTINSWAANAPSALTFNNVLNSSASGYTYGYETTAGLTHLISPTFVGELRFGLNRYVQIAGFLNDDANSARELGIGTSPSSLPPNMSVTSWAAMGPSSGAVRDVFANTFMFNASATKVWRTQTVKFGAQLRKNQMNTFSPSGYFMGNYTFTGSITNIGGVGGNAIDSLADFLLGQVTSAAYELPQPMTGRRNYNLGAYVQDDWKVSSRLTINAGLRWDYEAPLSVANHIFSRWDPVTGKLLVAGENASQTLNLETGKRNFQPRIGFAYTLDPRTVVRSAFGIFYSQLMSNLGTTVTYPGYDVTQHFLQTTYGLPQAFTLSQGMPLIAVQNLNNPGAVLQTATVANPAGGSGGNFADVSHIPSMLQWNFGVQRDLGRGVLVEANYVGNHAEHVPIFSLCNEPPFSAGTAIVQANNSTYAQQQSPFPLIGTWSGLYDSSDSSYEALQVRAQRRLSSNLAFQVGYTWSKSMDDVSGIFGNGLPNGLVSGQFPEYFRSLDHAVSDFDVPQNLFLTVQYRTRGSKWLRDFQISPIFTARDGKPLTITQTNEYPGAAAQRPMVTGTSGITELPQLTANGTGIQYLMLPANSAFPLSPSGPIFTGSGSSRVQIVSSAIGDLGRNTERGPGSVNLNLSVARTFHLTEKAGFQLRVDAFNVANHTNFGYPSSSLTVATSNGKAIFNSPGFGLITSAASARFLQIVTRFTF